MPNFATERIRNVVLLSHSGAGKTILAEAMLHATGATTRLGRVEDGTTASDFEPEEQKRQTSANAAVLNTQWKDHKINVIDTPGYADYRGEVVSSVRVADGAVIVVGGAGWHRGRNGPDVEARRRPRPSPRRVHIQGGQGERQLRRGGRGASGAVRAASRCRFSCR